MSRKNRRVIAVGERKGGYPPDTRPLRLSDLRAGLDFAAWGAAFGAKGLVLDDDDAVEQVVAEAMAHDGPVVVEVKASLERISAFVSIADLKG